MVKHDFRHLPNPPRQPNQPAANAFGFTLLTYVIFAVLLGMATPAGASETQRCLYCGFYIELGASVHRGRDMEAPKLIELADGSQVNYQRYHTYDINVTRNPYGIAQAGLRFNPSHKWTIDLALWRHESSLATKHDRGTDSHQLSVRWSPWGRQ